MKVAVCSWNTNEQLQKGRRLGLEQWMESVTARDGEGEGEEEAPAIYAVAFQETVVLPFALIGIGAAQLSSYDDSVREEIESHAGRFSKSPAGYTLVEKVVSGNCAILVYINDTLVQHVSDVLIANVGCGPLYMFNKGAVGVRFTLSSTQESFTFVSCHLAPHDHNTLRRNQDWERIVSGLTFEGTRSPSASSSSTLKSYQIYDTSYLFVAGDLNYRLNRKEPETISLSQIGENLHGTGLNKLLDHDQLRQEQKQGKTLHGLKEGQINFPPTYKFIKGTHQYKNFSQRVPAWCDRIMYAGYDAEATIKVEQYGCVAGEKRSDHKPVKAIFDLAPSSPSSSGPRLLSIQPPYPIDPRRHVKRLIGSILSKVVGMAWAILRTLGLGNPWLGASMLLLHTAATILDFDYQAYLMAFVYWLKNADKKEAYDRLNRNLVDRVDRYMAENMQVYFGPMKKDL